MCPCKQLPQGDMHIQCYDAHLIDVFTHNIDACDSLHKVALLLCLLLPIDTLRCSLSMHYLISMISIQLYLTSLFLKALPFFYRIADPNQVNQKRLFFSLLRGALNQTACCLKGSAVPT
jgi:hypothetical protein